jgi:type VI secretion system protein ImpA
MQDIESLLASLGDSAPSGSDLEYDPDFLALEQAGAGKPEQQFGDTVIPAEPADWRRVEDLADSLAQRTRDLRVAVWMVRCQARLHGLEGAAQALQLVHGLLERHWDTLHPQLDASDNNDPTMRLNALAPLLAIDAGLADLRAAALSTDRASLTVRDIELGLGRAEPAGDERAPGEAAVRQAVSELCAGRPQLAACVRAAADALAACARLLDERVGSGMAPDLTPLRRLFKALTDAMAAPGDLAADAPAEGDHPGAGARTAVTTPGTIASRDDALRMLDRVCDWIERNEPSHPAPLLIRRAQRLMTKSFVEIIRDLAPDGMGQVQMLAGPDADINN